MNLNDLARRLREILRLGPPIYAEPSVILSNEELSILHSVSRYQKQDRDNCGSTRAAETELLDSTHRVVITDKIALPCCSFRGMPSLVDRKIQLSF
jgi:hypothetical protein